MPEWKQYVKCNYNSSIIEKVSDPERNCWFEKVKFIQKEAFIAHQNSQEET